jgi:hypothetical protein
VWIPEKEGKIQVGDHLGFYLSVMSTMTISPPKR